jgi:hypothetical protein
MVRPRRTEELHDARERRIRAGADVDGLHREQDGINADIAANRVTRQRKRQRLSGARRC